MSSKTTPTPPRYLWQHPAWPVISFDTDALMQDLSHARLEQGKLLGLLEAIGLESGQEAARELWVQEAMATAAIEGEKLDQDAVRSSLAHRLGLAGLPTTDRHVDGLVQVMADATAQYQAPLTQERLCLWQAALFPGGSVNLRRVAVGRYRDHADAMQIVSGRLGREVVHYVAPPSAQVPQEMAQFLAWFECTHPAADAAPRLHGLVRAALAHLWFETIHPFEDGNGRLGRAIVDMALAQDMGAAVRVFGIARQMMTTRAAYDDALNQAQQSTAGTGLDVTPWVQWFVQACAQGCITSQAVVRQALEKAEFRQRAAASGVNARQTKVLDRLLQAGNRTLGGGFLGGMSSDKYCKLTGSSKATATRDLVDLAAKGLLRIEGVGKATRYAIAIDQWTQAPV
ncbi:Fic family protein [Rhodoferax antarcticus]|uniref:Fic family protein n=1 Tax=Rhodoferax antarcticus ANT.BR TaxID=1111071 RepID=A0A1Q8YHS6_9BURK|nr:Fic family protein [Rhodoferax antarcticus]APW45251.1 cell filamentation protein Fic [Rhodoferax antarcticus]MCW2311007.1 Fic family protein [Rhodoferax antarcticus]OLP07523.1 fic family protein [Rhodoferax antarcticus ANT.BR]